MFKKEEGFSLLELSVAIGLAAVFSATVVTLAPGFISGTKQTVESHGNCSVEKENAAKSFIEGEEYSGWDTPTEQENSECNLDAGGQ